MLKKGNRTRVSSPDSFGSEFLCNILTFLFILMNVCKIPAAVLEELDLKWLFPLISVLKWRDVLASEISIFFFFTFERKVNCLTRCR